MIRILSAAVAVMITGPAFAQDEAKPEFSRATIDLGVVVSDLDKSAKFYTDVIGFKEAEGFSVPAEFCQKAGLTDNQALTIRVFVLGEGPDATKLKLMQLPDVKSKKADHKHIHSTLGYSYLTIFVKDLDASIARLKKAKADVATEDMAVALPGGDLALTLVRDPDGNLIELIGPTKNGK